MGRLIAAVGSLLLVVTPAFIQRENTEFASQNQAKSSPVEANSSKKLIVEIMQTDWGVMGTNRFVFLRVFSDRSVEFHPKRTQSYKDAPVSREEISQIQLDMILALVEREDVKKLPRIFNSTFTPKDFYWTLDMKIPRGAQTQQIKLVNFSPNAARENNKPYPEALVRLACSVLALRRDLKAETAYSQEECKDFVTNH
jgi:hypothetical protein